MATRYSYTLSEDDHLAFWLLLSRAQYKKLLLVAAPLVVLATIWTAVQNGVLAGVILLLAAGIAGALAGRGLDWLLLPPLARKHFNENALLREEVELTFDDDSLCLSQRSGNLDFRWVDALKFDESDEVFAVFPARNVAYVIPKVTVPNSAIDGIRARLISSGLVAKGEVRK